VFKIFEIHSMDTVDVHDMKLSIIDKFLCVRLTEYEFDISDY